MTATMRPMLKPDSPPGRPQPRYRSSRSNGSSSGILSRAAFTIAAVRSSGRTSFNEPLFARPMGERAAETITASGMEGLRFFSCVRGRFLQPSHTNDEPTRGLWQDRPHAPRLLLPHAMGRHGLAGHVN